MTAWKASWAVIRAKMYPHRKGGDPEVDKKDYGYMYRFMEHRIEDEDPDYANIWGVENFQDLMQWEWPTQKNFGMDVVY